MPRRAKKRPHAARSLPRAGAGRRPKKARLPPSKACVQATQTKEQGPLRGGFHWGAPQTPAIMPMPKKARSSSSASAARKWPLHPHKVPFGPAHWGPQPAPQTPWARHSSGLQGGRPIGNRAHYCTFLIKIAKKHFPKQPHLSLPKVTICYLFFVSLGSKSGKTRLPALPGGLRRGAPHG